MSGPNKRTVSKRDDRKFEARASVVGDTQREVVDRTRQILANDGGGELAIRGLNGQIRAQDTIKPGNDPRRSKG
ncbi:MAG TPA: DUF2188 domain-containing protein [Actinopolymorphaceae bacterium]|jgi:hypothetical protein